MLKFILFLLAMTILSCSSLEISKDCKTVNDMDGYFVCKKL